MYQVNTRARALSLLYRISQRALQRQTQSMLSWCELVAARDF
jgi:hypothetical protein